ncbi:hypothetical protein B1759_11840 [Rubrivirga sp. SAORIC476]|uniref:transposase n=1 Tax=Rubrivirga sp. SAORIC476 TaxID=1961794 RepID=UPI000BA9570C|nr:transposase [Rubrivirga sp. SAORIC476]PAP79754.1 hypothetical protein B1759_11840 [Rubrivirga sp. SAORIC476]
MRRHRRSVRLRAHDYRAGLYFVTVCTHGRQRLFGDVVDGEVVLSVAGRIARVRTAEVRPSVVLDAFVVMPDHVHLLFGVVPDDTPRADDGSSRRGVLQYAPTDGAPRSFQSPSGSVGAVVRGYKGAVTNAIKRLWQAPDARVWQRSFHDRVVRTGREADAIRRYIADNPARWDPDAGRAD